MPTGIWDLKARFQKQASPGNSRACINTENALVSNPSDIKA
jgi:hypothetical protein